MPTTPASAIALAHLVDRVRDDRARSVDWIPVLQTVPLLAGLNARHLRKVAAIASPRRIHDATRIVREGDPGRAFFILLEGSATVRRERGGSPVTLGPGAYFGELALIDDGPRTATVSADGEVLVLEVSRSSFGKLLKDEPTIAVGLLRELARRLRDER